jgi:hypothetical protein
MTGPTRIALGPAQICFVWTSNGADYVEITDYH